MHLFFNIVHPNAWMNVSFFMTGNYATLIWPLCNKCTHFIAKRIIDNLTNIVDTLGERGVFAKKMTSVFVIGIFHWIRWFSSWPEISSTFYTIAGNTMIFVPQNDLKLGQNGQKSCGGHPKPLKFGTYLCLMLFLSLLARNLILT